MDGDAGAGAAPGCTGAAKHSPVYQLVAISTRFDLFFGKPASFSTAAIIPVRRAVWSRRIDGRVC